VVNPCLLLANFQAYEQYENMKRVDTFYPREWVRMSPLRGGGPLITAIVAVFGGIHCIGRPFTFSSSIEQPSGVLLPSV